MRVFSNLVIFLLIVSYTAVAQPAGSYFTQDGSWCWFSDPRAIVVDDYVITGWVKSNGTIEAALLDTQSDSIRTMELYYRLEADDHNNPAFVTSAHGQILAMYTRHSKKDLFINSLSDYSNSSEFSSTRFIHPFSAEEYKKFPRQTMTYANPFRLEKEDNRIYCFGRWTGF